MAFDFGAFWFPGQQIRTGQANVKQYNRRLAELIHYGRAKPEQIISHRLKLADGPTLTSTSMRAITAGPKLCLNQRLEFCLRRAACQPARFANHGSWIPNPRLSPT
jgi:hypothetical protein